MTDPDRIERLALEGDVDAARQWCATARRRGAVGTDDRVRELLRRAIDASAEGAMATLAIGLDALDTAADVLAALWRGGEHARLERAAVSCGVSLDTTARADLDRILVAANHGAAERRLRRWHLLSAMLAARLGPSGLAVRHASLGAGDIAMSGVVLAVVDPPRAHLVIGAARGSGGAPGPARAWSDLNPWAPSISPVAIQGWLPGDSPVAIQGWLPGDSPVAIQGWLPGDSPVAAQVLAWMRKPAADRVALGLVELPERVEAARRRRAVVLADPIERLASGAASREAFAQLVEQVDGLAGDDRVDHLARALDAELEAWPDAERMIGTAWLERLEQAVERGDAMPSTRLVRWFESRYDSGLSQRRIDALAASPAADRLVAIAMAVVSPVLVERLLQAHAWPALRVLELSTSRDGPRRRSGQHPTAPVRLLDALHRARAGLLGRVEALDIDLERAWTHPMPANVWTPPPDGELRLSLHGVYTAPTDARWRSALSALALRLSSLRSARLASGQWLDILQALDAGGDGELRQLMIDCLMFSLDQPSRLTRSRASGLESLSIRARGDSPQRGLRLLAGKEAVRGVRRLMLDAPLSSPALGALPDGPLCAGLEALTLFPHGALDRDALYALLSSPGLSTLRSLGLPHALATEVAAWLTEDDHLEHLDALHVHAWDETDTAALDDLASARRQLEIVAAS